MGITNGSSGHWTRSYSKCRAKGADKTRRQSKNCVGQLEFVPQNGRASLQRNDQRTLFGNELIAIEIAQQIGRFFLPSIRSKRSGTDCDG